MLALLNIDSNRMTETPRIHDVTTVAQTRIFQIERVSLEFSNGAKRQFERINNGGPGAVMVLAITSDELILVREYAVGAERYELGFVKGLIDPGETPEHAAERELKEEIGYGALDIRHVRKMTATPHYTCSISHLLLAQDLYPETRQGDEPEALTQLRWPLTELDSLLEHPDITDARTLHAIYWLRDYLNNVG